ncbi:hypothetical protein GCM10010170_058670 [Dactylosporangium salmoneum]|uniref:Uncharacterized protein n=2 Tax=Dactylosporangium salmoneum TaxID=53361 RepID=A0ABN3GVV6_9ACTN
MRSHGYHFDDLVVFGSGDSDDPCAAWQIKFKLTVTASDKEFMDVVTAGLFTLAEQNADPSAGIPAAIGVIAFGAADAVDQLRKLHEFADGHSDAETFEKVFQANVVDAKVRNRLVQVRKAVQRSIDEGAPALGNLSTTTHALLAALQVWRPATADDGADYLETLNSLGPVSADLGTTPKRLFGHIGDLAQRWALSAGVVREDRVLRRLQIITGLRPVAAKALGTAAAPDRASLDVSAIVLGPIDGHALRPAIEEAEQLVKAGDVAAAGRFADIAAQFEQVQFWPYANMMRRRQASALHAAGETERAILLRAELAWAAVDRLQAWEGRFVLHDDYKPGDDAAMTAMARRVWRCADAAVGYMLGEDFIRFVSAFDALEVGDPHWLRAAAFLAEYGVAQDQPSWVLDRAAQLTAGLTSVGLVDGPAYAAIRVRMCLADVTGTWDAFFREFRRRADPFVRAWLNARYARHFALTGDGQAAVEFYLDAVELAADQENLDDAADWLYALRTVRFWYEDLPRSEQHQIAQALRPLARPSRMPGSQHAAEFALRELSGPEPTNNAEPALRQWRWQAYVRGQLTDEMYATETLASMLRRTGHVAEALVECVRAARNDIVSKIAEGLPESRVDLADLKSTGVPRSRAARFTVAAAAADLLPDADAKTLAVEALAVLAEQAAPSSISHARRPKTTALEFLAAIGSVLTAAQRQELIEHVTTLFGPGLHPRNTDDAVMAIVATAVSTPEPDDHLDLLARAVESDPENADRVMRRVRLSADQADRLEVLLASAAVEHRHVALALLVAGRVPEGVVSHAASAVARVIERAPQEPSGVGQFSNGPEAGVFARVLPPATRRELAEAFVASAANQAEDAWTRAHDLRGLHNLAEYLDEGTRAGIRPTLLTLARTAEANDLFVSSEELACWALKVAAQLGLTDAEAAEAEQLGLGLLRVVPPDLQWVVAGALTRVPAATSRISPTVSAYHPLAAVRSLAVARWQSDPASISDDAVLKLAKDEDARVRRQLATAIAGAVGYADDALVARLRSDLAGDARRSVRRIVVAVG